MKGTVTMLNIGVAGLSSRTLSFIRHLRARTQFEANFPFVLKGCFDDRKSTHIDFLDVEMTDDIRLFVQAENVDVIVDTYASIKTSQEIVRQALMAGKHVISSNTAMMAIHGETLMKIAASAGRHLLVTPALGGMPVLHSLCDGAAHWYPTRVCAAMNSSCNMALSRMLSRGENMQQAMKSAQELGLASRGTDYDISGKESLYYAGLLHFLSFGKWLDLKPIMCTPLDVVEMQDILLVDKLGGRIQYMCVVTTGDARVGPIVVPNASMLGQVNGSMTALQIEGEQIGIQFLAGFAADNDGWIASIEQDLMTILHKRTPQKITHPSRRHRSTLKTEKRYFVRLPAEQMDIFTTASPIVITDQTVITCMEQQWCGMLIETESELTEIDSFLGESALIIELLSD